MYYTYVLCSKSNNRLYVGSSENLRQRLAQHLRKQSWTTARMKNLELIFYEAFKTKSDAVRCERYFKTSKGKSSLKQIIRDSLL